MKLSVVILNYNVRYFLEQCLYSVQKAIEKLDAEIIVIDNNSTDDSCEMVKSLFSNVILLENNENKGFSKANNQAVKFAKGEYVCILNPDTAVAEDTFLKVLNFAATQENLGAVGVYFMDGTGNFLPESKRNLPTPKASILKLTGFVKKYYASYLHETETGEVAVLAGAFMLLKRTVYNEVNGFDEDYFMYGEDIDLSYKLMKAGYKNHYFGFAGILHYKGESPQNDEAYLERFYGAMRIFYKKHFNTNIVFDVSVKVAVTMAKQARMMKKSKKPFKVLLLQKAYFITENPTLIEAISPKLNIPLQMVSKNFPEGTQIENTMLIFDAEYIEYAQIFRLMHRFKNKGNAFRIRPPKCNFIIGSDRSDEKGSVVLF